MNFWKISPLLKINLWILNDEKRLYEIEIFIFNDMLYFPWSFCGMYFANRKERHRQSRAWTTHTSFRIYTVEHRANRSSSNPTPDPINGFLVEPRTCSAMNVTTVVIERNCIIREGESSLIAEADSSDGKGMIRDGVFRFGSSSFIYLYICPISFFFFMNFKTFKIWLFFYFVK